LVKRVREKTIKTVEWHIGQMICTHSYTYRSCSFLQTAVGNVDSGFVCSVVVTCNDHFVAAWHASHVFVGLSVTLSSAQCVFVTLSSPRISFDRGR